MLEARLDGEERGRTYRISFSQRTLILVNRKRIYIQYVSLL